MKKFNAKEFLATLDVTGKLTKTSDSKQQAQALRQIEKIQTQSKTRGNWLTLYQNFLRSPNFHGWYEKRRKEMQDRIYKLHFIAISEISPGSKNWIEKTLEEQVEVLIDFKDLLKQMNLAIVYESENRNYDQMSKISERFLKIFSEKERVELVQKISQSWEGLVFHMPKEIKQMLLK